MTIGEGASSSGSGARIDRPPADLDPRSRGCTRRSTRGQQCTLVDEGLSRNGSFVNGERVGGRRRLRDGDTLRSGKPASFPRTGPIRRHETVMSADVLTAAGVSPAQKRVLVALCRPFKGGAAFATPSTNGDIAAELHLSRRRRQDPPAGAVREVRGRGPAAEPKARGAR